MSVSDYALSRREELAWAGGLFEGEGCFSTVGRVGSQGRRYGRAQLAMNDEDVVVRFGTIMGFGNFTIHRRTGAGHHDLRVWSATNFEHFQATVAMLWPWLGSRRRARARELLQSASLPTSKPWDVLKGRTP